MIENKVYFLVRGCVEIKKMEVAAGFSLLEFVEKRNLKVAATGTILIFTQSPLGEI